MPASFAVAAGRRAAERRMTDACEIRTPPVMQFNPETHRNEIVSGNVLIYTGKCRVKAQTAMGDREQTAGEAPVSTWAVVVSIPIGATYQGGPVPVTPDCLAKFTKSNDDPALVGQTLRVRQVPAGSNLTARRMVCEVYGG